MLNSTDSRREDISQQDFETLRLSTVKEADEVNQPFQLYFN